jgi:hypothetical protein
LRAFFSHPFKKSIAIPYEYPFQGWFLLIADIIIQLSSSSLTLDAIVIQIVYSTREKDHAMDSKPFLIDTSEQAAIIHYLSEKLRAFYVFPDIAEEICACLQKHLDEGDYVTTTEGELFAMALTLHMQEISHDEHLWVRCHLEPLPNHEGQLHQDGEWQELKMVEARLDNYGLHRLERLPGNVGYLDIHYLHRPIWGGDTLVSAINFLANTNAVIIDLRKCEGGYPGMIALICSYLFEEEPIHLDSIYWRDDDRTQQYWTLPYVPGKRYLDKPVYVLISKDTFSGGESIASILQTRQRAILVGEKTDGGAHPGVSYRLHSHFEAFIPIGRNINPVTGTDWEATGVIPDITAVKEQSFDVAYQMALKSIVQSLGESPSGPMKAYAQEVKIALTKSKGTSSP